MYLLSAENVFSDIFGWFARLSSKLPAIDYRTYFIVVVALLLGIGLIIALTYFGSYRFKLLVACRRIIGYLADVEAIDNENFGDFTAQCFSAKAPSTLRDCWVQYLGVRFGYPSDIVSEQNVYDREVKRVREIRANIFIAVALILIAIFSFWGYGRLNGNDMGVIFLASLLLSGAIYLVLVILNKMLSNRCLDVFNSMQEDLDAKVIFQVEKSFATDSSPLGDLAAIIDEIVARNTAKEIGFEFADEQTPIEELIAKADDGGAEKEPAKEDGAGLGNNAEGETVAEEILDGEPENMTVDDVLAEEIFDSYVGGEDNQQGADSVADEVSANIGEPVSETVTDDGGDVHQGDVADGESAASGSEIEKESDDVIEGEPVEIINGDAEEEREENKASEDDGKKEFSEDGENPKGGGSDVDASDILENENAAETSADDNARVTEEEQAVEASSDVNESDDLSATENNGRDEQSETNAEKQEIKSDGGDDPDGEGPIIQYVMDGPMDDDEEIVKPAQLVKMPNLVDYMIAQNASTKLKMSIVNKLMASYKKFENSEEDKKIIVDCIKKLMADLQSKR